MYIYDHLSHHSYNMKCFRQTFRENQITHLIFNNFFFRKSCHLRDNGDENDGRCGQDTDDKILRRMSFACRLIKSANTQSEYVTFFAFALRQW